MNDKNEIKNQKLKVLKIQKIALGILCGIILLLGVIFMIENFITQNISYFTAHFMTCVLLLCVGSIIEILVAQSKSKVSGDGKGDSFMEKVAIIAFILAFLSIAISYIS